MGIAQGHVRIPPASFRVAQHLTGPYFVHTICSGWIEFAQAKNERNIRERGLPFERAAEFEFETALFRIDYRRDYGETRIRALGMLDGRLHALVFVETSKGIRVISFRRANAREVRRYEQAATCPPDRPRQSGVD
jgi:uncharacterized DUF497 family protein